MNKATVQLMVQCRLKSMSYLERLNCVSFIKMSQSLITGILIWMLDNASPSTPVSV